MLLLHSSIHMYSARGPYTCSRSSGVRCCTWAACIRRCGMAAASMPSMLQSQRERRQANDFASMRAQDMKEHVAKQLDEHRDNAAISQPGKEWVRGWDDWNSSQGSNAARAPERKA